MHLDQLRRREFITLLGGAAAAWPLAARAQQADRVRRVGVLIGTGEAEARYDPFREGLAQIGWTEVRNIRFDYRWTDKQARPGQRLRARAGTEDPAGPHAGEAAEDQGDAATVHAPADPRAGEVAGAGRPRLLQLPRGAD
jgi:hypothetical protein